MQQLDLVGGVVEWWGAAWVDVGPRGVSPRRLAGLYRSQVGDLARRRIDAASGVRCALATDAVAIELECWLDTLTPGTPVRDAVADLVIDGELVASRGPVALSAAASSGPGFFRFRFRFERPQRRVGVVEVWLPHDAVVTVERLAVDPGARVAPPRRSTDARWVHHGSSISHGGEARSPARTWPAIVARKRGLSLTNLAFAGECQLDQFAARSIRDLPAEVISLELGVNVVNGATMVERTFTSALHGFLDTIRDGHPETPVLVVSPIVFPAAERRPGPTVLRDGRLVAVGDPGTVGAGGLSIGRVREVIAAVVAERTAHGDTALRHLDGRELLGPTDADALGDGLHPGPEGHELIADRLIARFPTSGH
ncbi:MAG: SGNH/GDSL hydrolase family protein [Actinomycetota bacterium]|nr:SGNH/GDSL hydrolase family protein [Actinomycetota bacterium]